MKYFLLLNLENFKYHIKYIFLINVSLFLYIYSNKILLFENATNIIDFSKLSNLSTIEIIIKIVILFYVFLLSYKNIDIYCKFGLNTIGLRINKNKFFLFALLNCNLVIIIYSILILISIIPILDALNIIKFIIFNLIINNIVFLEKVIINSNTKYFEKK